MLFSFADLTHQLQGGEEDGVVATAEERADTLDEVVDELGALAQDADRAERRLLRDERVRADHQLLDLGREVAADLGRRDVADRAAREAADVLVLRLQVVLQRVLDEHQHLESAGGRRRR